MKIEAFDLSSNRIFAATQSQQVIVFDALSESVRLGFDKSHFFAASRPVKDDHNFENHTK